MPTTFTETMHTGEYLVSEANGSRSREVGLLASGQVLPAGAVLGKITATGKLTQLNPAATDGSQTAMAVLYARTDASAGDRSVTVTARATEVNGLCLTWPAGITGSQMAAAITSLATSVIIVRT